MKETAIELGECPSCEGITLERAVEPQQFCYGKGSQQVELVADVPVWRCRACGFTMSDGESEVIRHETICRHFGLLTPQEIRDIRESTDLSQSHFAILTGFGLASIKRWETGALLQNVSADRLLRLLTEPRAVQRLLAMQSVNGTAPRSPRFQTTLPPEARRQAGLFHLCAQPS